MQRHEVTYIVDAPVEKVWGVFHAPPPPGSTNPRRLEYPGGFVEILIEADEDGKGLVRECGFQVPKYLLSGGMARSWEVVYEGRKHEYARYRAVGKPLWSRAEGWHELSTTADGKTRLTFVETYHVVNPLMRVLLEKRVHQFISRNNSALYKKILGYLGQVTEVHA
jgi:hypothetical protein